MSRPSSIALPPPGIVKLEVHDDNDDEQLGLANDANGNAPNTPSLWGIPLKYISLVTLAVQNSMLTIIMHYSRVSTPPSQAYSAGTAVLMNEILKGLISFAFALARVDAPSPSSPYLLDAPKARSQLLRSAVHRFTRVSRDVFSPDCWKLSIPAILYVIQNNLQYVAATNLEAATFQVSYQMKILTTAAFSVVMLRKKLAPVQWLALVCLAVGVGIVQIQAGAGRSGAAHELDPTRGFLANSPGDLWVRNVQLSLFSLLPALAPIAVSARDTDAGASGVLALLFRNFGPWAWATVAVQVAGGLVTAMVIKYSDNILKGFATSLSIVISFMASVALFDFHLTFTFVLGSSVVLVATWLYNQQPRRARLVSNTHECDQWTQVTRPDKWKGARSPAVEERQPFEKLRVLSTSSSFSSLPGTRSTSGAPSPTGSPTENMFASGR
ncbi:nucleotide-sugar transporter-domain-containing protein [Schizophyllum amplum]|uniref:Nucleotide-sugar transporter-domain-containing protein n=1 Tax=Schizophyllum amplum TaxID=97359 RepID=A0A550BYG7_9AGAR|nr:nucleotide-sugar transporter-domain-containing protein [Auriculariopsis ampla]